MYLLEQQFSPRRFSFALQWCCFVHSKNMFILTGFRRRKIGEPLFVHCCHGSCSIGAPFTVCRLFIVMVHACNSEWSELTQISFSGTANSFFSKLRINQLRVQGQTQSLLNLLCETGPRSLAQTGAVTVQERLYLFNEYHWCFTYCYLKLELVTFGNYVSCSMRLLEKQLRCALPSHFCSGSHFILVVVALSFKSSLHQRFTMRWNSCRESCSWVNWSVSARLKTADGVVCRRCWQQRWVLECKAHHLFQRPINSYRHHLSLRSEV